MTNKTMLAKDILCVFCAFTTWTTLQAWFYPMNQSWFGDPEILNWIFRFTLPACFVAIVFHAHKYYKVRESLLDVATEKNPDGV